MKTPLSLKQNFQNTLTNTIKLSDFSGNKRLQPLVIQGRVLSDLEQHRLNLIAVLVSPRIKLRQILTFYSFTSIHFGTFLALSNAFSTLLLI
jgi:hypothetical protein